MAGVRVDRGAEWFEIEFFEPRLAGVRCVTWGSTRKTNKLAPRPARKRKRGSSLSGEKKKRAVACGL